MIRIDIIIRQKRTLPLLRFNETLLAESFFILFYHSKLLPSVARQVSGKIERASSNKGSKDS